MLKQKQIHKYTSKAYHTRRQAVHRTRYTTKNDKNNTQRVNVRLLSIHNFPGPTNFSDPTQRHTHHWTDRRRGSLANSSPFPVRASSYPPVDPHKGYTYTRTIHHTCDWCKLNKLVVVMWRPRSVHVTSQCVTFVRSSLHYIYICTSTSKEENKSSYCELSRTVPKEQQAKQKLPSAFSLLAIPLPQRHVHLVILCRTISPHQIPSVHPVKLNLEKVLQQLRPPIPSVTISNSKKKK